MVYKRRIINKYLPAHLRTHTRTLWALESATFVGYHGHSTVFVLYSKFLYKHGNRSNVKKCQNIAHRAIKRRCALRLEVNTNLVAARNEGDACRRFDGRGWFSLAFACYTQLSPRVHTDCCIQVLLQCEYCLFVVVCRFWRCCVSDDSRAPKILPGTHKIKWFLTFMPFYLGQSYCQKYRFSTYRIIFIFIFLSLSLSLSLIVFLKHCLK